MNRISLRSILVPLAGAAFCFAISPRPDMAARGGFLAQFAAKAKSVSGPEDAGRIEIYIERWSTDQELDSLRGKFTEGGPDKLLPVLERQRRRAGVVLMPGVQAHGARVRTRTPKNLQFAREIITPTGRQLILASDEHLGLGETRLDARKEVYDEFNLMDIRFDQDGTGIGKVAGPDDVVYNPVTKTLEMKNYETQPVRLVDIRAEKP